MKILNNRIKVKKHINLLPMRASEAKKLNTRYNFSLIGLLFIIVFGVFLINWQFNISSALNASKMNKTKEVEELSFIEVEEAKLLELKSIIEKRKKFEANIDKSNSNMLDVIDLLKDIETDSVDITNLQDKIEYKEGIKEYSITISGICKTNEDVAHFSTKLRDSNMFSTIFVPNISQTLPSFNYVIEKPVNFSVMCVFPTEDEVPNG